MMNLILLFEFFLYLKIEDWLKNIPYDTRQLSLKNDIPE
jgi:hypothetical protein